MLSTKPDNILPTFRSFLENMSTAVLEGMFEDADNNLLFD